MESSSTFPTWETDQDQPSATRSANQQDRDKDASGQSQTPETRRRTSESGRSDQRTRDTADDRFETRRDRQDDRFDQRDDRFSTDQDRSDRRMDSQRDRFQGRTEADARLELGASLETNEQDQLVVSNLSSRGLLVDSGIRQDDVIVAVDDRPISSQAEFTRTIRYYDGPRVPVIVLRDGRRQTIFVTVDQSRRTTEYRGYLPDGYRNFDRDRAWLGVYLDTRYQDHAVVEAVEIGSAADRAGLRAGDWILGVNDQRIQGPTHLSRMIRAMEPGQEIRLDVSRRVSRDILTQLGERPDSYGRFRYEADEDRTRGTADRDTFEQRTYRGEFETEGDNYQRRTYRGGFDVNSDDDRDQRNR